MVLSLTPAASDLWGLKATAAGLRVACLAALLLPVATSSPSSLAAAMCRLATTVAVETSVLLSQPFFATLAGGVFRPGDASNAAIARIGRVSWAGTETHELSVVLPLAGAVLALLVLDHFRSTTFP